jgi:hypothetical protein
MSRQQEEVVKAVNPPLKPTEELKEITEKNLNGLIPLIDFFIDLMKL